MLFLIPARNIKSPSAQLYYAVNENGQVYTWGANTSGQLGDNTVNTASSAVATVVGGRLFSKIVQVQENGAAPANFAGLELFTGNAFSWGSNASGQLGNNSTVNSSSPVSVVGGRVFRDIVIDATVGNSYIGIEASTGRLWGWGMNSSGQLGSGTASSASSPVSVLGGRSYSQLYRGGANSYAIEGSTGNVYAWGVNTKGQLGVNSVASASSPVSVFGGRSFKSLSIGSGLVAGIEGSTGNAYIWGGGSGLYGQLGNNTTAQASSPVSVFGGRSFSQILLEYTGNNVLAVEASTGAAYSWGYNLYGQLGNNSTADASSPVSVLGGRSFGKIEKGSNFSTAIEGSTGTIFAWGVNSSGQLGTGNFISYSSPVAVLSGKSFSFISTGDNSSVAVEGSTGQLYAWGLNGGTLTIPSPSVYNPNSPVSLSGANRTFRSLSVGDSTAFGVALESSTGLAYAWGDNASGQLGNNSTVLSLTPVSVRGGRSYASIGAGLGAVYAIAGSNGNLYAWGKNNLGQLGDGTTFYRSSPVLTGIGSGYSYKQIASYSTATFALEGNGRLYAWGANSSGTVGDGTSVNRSYPTQVRFPKPISFTQAAIAYGSGAGLDFTGNYYAWGANDLGQLGNLNTENTFYAYSYPLIGGSFSQITPTGTEMYALLGPAGIAYAWGKNHYGQLGNNTFTLGANAFFPISIYSSKSFKEIVAGNVFSLAIDSTGQISTWGYNNVGQLGNGTTTNSSTPTTISSSISFSKIATLTAYPATVFAIEGSTGRAYGWGSNFYGELGTDSTSYASSPVSVLGGRSFKDILYSGVGNVVAIEGSTGNAYTWGRNRSGQLGNNSMANSSIPVSVLGGRSFSQACVLEDGVAAIEGSTGRVWTWGTASWGLLGNNSINNSSSPVSVLGGRSFSKISSSEGFFYIGIEGSTGNAYSWGTNNYGYLGNGDVATQGSPVSVLGGRSWSQINCLYQSVMAIEASTGNIYTWGDNSYGQLGNNSTVKYSSPVSIVVTRSFKQIVSSSNNSYGYTCLALEASTGLVWGWGRNDSYGISGKYGTNNVSSPVVISSVSFSRIGYEAQSSFGIEGSTGRIHAWGYNGNGALGVGAYSNDASSPVSVVGARSFKRIVVDSVGYTALGIDTNGYLWSWGDNTYGQLGNNSGVHASSSPVSVLGGRSYSEVLIHNAAVHAIEGSTGYVYSWGYNGDGRLGNNSVSHQSSPVSVLLGARSMRQVVANNIVAAALDGINGGVYVWGNNAFGQLGNNSTVNASSPVSVLGGRSYRQLTITGYTSAGALAAIEGSTGNMYTWGSGNIGQLGNNTTANASSPISVVGGRSYSQVSGDNYQGLAFVAVEGSTGNLYGWGLNTSGQLGNNTVNNASSPVSVMGGISFSTVRMYANNTYGLDSTGQLYVWGQQPVGTGVTGYASSPLAVVSVSPRSMSLVVVDINSGNVLAKDLTGNVWAWGPGTGGILGNNYIGTTVVPSSVLGGRSFWQIFSGTGSFYGIEGSTGNAYAWGTNTSGQLGTGTVNVSSPTSVFAPTSLTKKSFSRVTMGAAIEASTGIVHTWGGNTNGQLGNNSALQPPAGIVSVATNRSFRQIAGDSGSQYFNVALEASTGNAYAWGRNFNGQLGIGTVLSASSPTSVLGGRSFAQVTVAGGLTAAAIDGATGNAYVWGRGPNGQLGNNTVLDASSPVSVFGGRSFGQIYLGYLGNSVFGIEANTGNIYGWGANNAGQLGIGTLNSQSSPAAVLAAIFETNKSFSQVMPSLYAYTGSTVFGVEGSTGNIYSWGNNSGGQLGNNTTNTVAVGIGSVSGGRSFSSVITSLDGTMALAIEASTGNAYAWGNNFYGGLGNNSTVYASSPVSVVGGRSFRQIFVGGGASIYTAYAIEGSTGNAYCWGYGNNGQLGNGAGANSSSPTSVLGGRSFTRIFALSSTAFGIEGSTGNLYAWGQNNIGQLGNGTTTNSNSPVAVYAADTLVAKSFRQVTAGYAIEASTGNLFSWGSNTYGQLGNNSTNPGIFGIGSVFTSKSFSQVSADTINTFFVTALEASTGYAYSWGQNTYGQLGNSSTTNASSPVSVIGGRSFKTVTASYGINWAIEGSTGRMYSWGFNNQGQLGNNTSGVSVSSPVSVVGGRSFKSFTASSFSVLALEGSTGNAYGWGVNTSAELGINSTIYVSSPTSVLGGRSYSQIYLGNVTLAIEGSTGNAWTWGNNFNGMLGNNSTVNGASSPVSVVGGRSWRQLIGASAIVALEASTGNAYTWGDGAYGQLGNNTAVTASSPVSVFGGRSFSQVTTLRNTVMAIEGSTGNVYAWGDNAFGVLGNNTSGTRASSPVSVFGGRSYSSVSIWPYGPDAAYVFATEGSTGNIYAWGRNAENSLGSFGPSNTSSPVLVVYAQGTKSFSQIAYEGNAALVALEGSTGNLWSWGSSAYGQMGHNSTVSSSYPISVVGGRSYSQVVGGNYTFLALEGSTGNAYGWGNNNVGQVGNGSTAVGVSSPTSVVGGRSFKQIYNSADYPVAIEGSTGNAYTWGLNSSGQLGNNTVANASSPTSVVGGRSFASMGAYNYSVFGVEGSTGNIYAWGKYTNNSLGAYRASNASSPEAVGYIQSLRSFKQIAVNATGAVLALEASSGNIYSWGGNTYGDSGNNTVSTGNSLPVSVLGGRSYSQIFGTNATSASNSFVAIEGSTGNAYAWGLGSSGQIGNNAVASASSPVSVFGGRSFAAVAVGSAAMAALEASTGNIYTWGNANNGQLGKNSAGSASSPVSVVGGRSFSQVICDSGLGNFFATEGSTGNIYGWGYNTNNALGSYSIVAVSSPVAVVYPQGLRSFSQIVTDKQGNSAMALEASTGNLYGWGGNSNGQLGIDSTAQALPSSVVGGRSFSQVVASNTTSFSGYLAIEGSTGNAYAWGTGGSGSLGRGSASSASSPVSVLGGRSYSNIFVSSGSVFATEGTTGQVYAWGTNGAGQLGINSISGYALSPVSISGIPNFNKGL